MVLDQTPFYAESGGQIADSGVIELGGTRLLVRDVQRPVKGLVVHTVEVKGDGLRIGAAAHAKVDPMWRVEACQAHSGTHVVHAALREVLGPSALQSGSYNKPGYLRLDFAWNGALDAATRSELEEVANLAVRDDLPVSAHWMSLPAAREWGALALFGETYDEDVRVIEIGGPWSRELCGGTHVQHSSQIGALTLTGESSVGSGSRRLEAFVGLNALRHLATERALVAELSTIAGVQPTELKDKVSQLVARLKETEREITAMKRQQAQGATAGLVDEAEQVGGIQLVTKELPEVDGGDLRTVAQDVRGRFGDAAAAVALVSTAGAKPVVVVATTQAARDAGVKAGALVKAAATALGGGGGGKDDLAQGGGQDNARAADALAAIRAAVANA